MTQNDPASGATSASAERRAWQRLPTFAELYAWAKKGLGIAVIHKTQYDPADKDMVFEDMSETFGLTQTYLYFRKRHDLEWAAKDLLDAFEQWQP